MSSSSIVRSQYNQLCQHLKKIGQLKGIEYLLEWDEMVMMPEQGAAPRSEQKQLLGGILYDHVTHPEIGKLLQELASYSVDSQQQAQQQTGSGGSGGSDEESLNEFERANIILARHEYDRKVKVPKELIEKQSKLNSDGYHSWVNARKNSDWSQFSPFLAQWIQLKKTMSELIDPEQDAYNVCLDEYESGLSCERIDQVFGQIKESLVPLIQKIEQAKSKVTIDESYLSGEEGAFPIEKQQELNRSIAEQIGYDFKSGRIDVSVHPFTISPAPGFDVRITTRYRTTEFLQGLAGTVHESGHAMYEQNLPTEYANLPVSNALSMGVHESQSLFWERHVALSKPFFKRFWPQFRTAFPHLPDSVSVDEVFRAANTVQPIFIRVESDEVTYPLHIILRYEIERGLFDGTYSVDGLPDVWNKKMKDYLGVTPSNDTEGILQDVHWGMGYYGYFPTYLLGAAIAAQIAAKLPNFESLLENGEYKEIKTLLTERIHSRGSADLNADKLLERATGEPLNPKYFIDYLTQKYTEIYQL